MIGSFLSRQFGSFSVSENIAILIDNSGLQVSLCSMKRNQVLRLLEIIIKSLFSDYDKMHIDTYSGKAFIIAETASIIGGLRNKKIILTLHGGKLPELFEKAPKRVQRVFRRASFIQTPSRYLQDFFYRQNLHVIYLPNPINLTQFTYNRSEVIPYSILWVRAFTEIYNPAIAIKALKLVREKYLDATLIMAGPDKGNLSEIKTLIKDLKLESYVILAGPVENKELFKYYQTHHVYINTPSYESFGVSVLEAAACGIPIVSTNVGEIPFLWSDNENILLVDDFSAKGFSDKIERIFLNEGLSQKLSKNARKKAETFDWENIKPKWEQLLMC